MRAPLLSIVLLAVVATGPLVPVCFSRYEKSGSIGEASPAAVATGSSVKPLSVDGYGPLEKVAEKPKEEKSYVQATPAKTSDTYDKKPVKKVNMDTASPSDEFPDTYEQSPIRDKEAEEAYKKETAHEAAFEKKIKKEKKEKSDDPYKVEKNSNDLDEATSSKKKKKKSDDLDESTSPKTEKKEKYDDSDESSSSKKEKKEKYDESSSSSKKEKKEKYDDSDESLSSKKKKKTEKSDDSGEDAPLKNKKKKKSDDDSDEYASDKKEKKDKSDVSDIVSHKKEKKEKSIDSNASAYVNKEEKKSHDSDDDSDEGTSAKKEKKEKKKKKEKEVKSGEDATPVNVSSTGAKEEDPNKDAMPVDVSATGQYVSSSKADGKPKGGEPVSSTAANAYPSPKPVVAPSEVPPTAAKSSTTSDAYASPKQDASIQPMGGAPDELPPAAKSSATPDAYASPQQDVASSQPMGGAPDELPPAAKRSATPAAYDSPDGAVGQKPKLSMETFSGMIRQPIANIMTPAIKKVCGNTEYPTDCEESIEEVPGVATAAKTATDSLGVLKLAMEAVRQKTVEALNAATDRMHAPGTDPTTKEALGSCTSSYSDIKTSLDTAGDALKRGDVDTAKTNLDSVETDVTTCDDGFNDRGTPSVMKDHDQELQKLASNLLSIGQGIKRY